MDKKIIEAASAWLKDRADNWMESSTGRYLACGGYFDSSLKPSKYGTSIAVASCHGFMQYSKLNAGDYCLSVKDPKQFVFANVLSRDRRPKEQETEATAFIKYIVQDSPVSKFILNRDNLEECLHGGVIIDCPNAGSQITLWICKTLRTCIEDTWRVKVWYQLVELGVHPMLAFATACRTTGSLSLSGGTHNTTMSPPTDLKQVKALFIKNIPAPGKWDTGWDTNTLFPSIADRRGSSLGILPISREGSKKIKVPDGWGGYVEKVEPFDIKVLAADLVKIQKQAAKEK